MKITRSRDFYRPHKGTCLELPKELNAKDCEVWVYSTDKGPIAIGFRGKAAKPAFHVMFKDTPQRDEYILKFYLDVYSQKKKSLARKEYKNQLVKGQILYSTWGYEQTNCNFYQVTEVSGLFVTVKEIQMTKEDGKHYMTHYVTPIKDKFKGKENYRRKALHPGDNINVDDVRWAKIWTGKPIHITSYY